MANRGKKPVLIFRLEKPGPLVKQVILFRDLLEWEGDLREEFTRFLRAIAADPPNKQRTSADLHRVYPPAARMLSEGVIRCFPPNDFSWWEWIRTCGVDYVPSVATFKGYVHEFIALKLCRGCENVLSTTKFHRNGPRRFDSQCKMCRNPKKKAARTTKEKEAGEERPGFVVGDIPDDLRPLPNTDLYQALMDLGEEED